MQLQGKTVLFLGSSVTYGSASGGVSFAELMAQACGCHCVKEAVSGTTLADIDESSYVARLKTVDTALPVDLFICQLSTNDVGRRVPIEQTEAALRFIIAYVKETFGCPIAFYTNTYYPCEEYQGLVDLLYRLQKEADFAVLDFWNDESMNAISDEQRARYMRDPVHPTLEGYREWWMPKFIAFCEKIS